VLGDAKLDVLAAGRHLPALRRDHLLVAEHIGVLAPIENAPPVDPAAEIGRDGDVGRAGDDARGQLAVAAGEIVEDPAETFLRRHARRLRQRQRVRHRHRRGGQPAVAPRGKGHLGEKAFQCLGGKLEPGEGLPFAPLCVSFMSPAWLSLWPAKGRPKPLIV
jgi:hypothetical protein